jgi:hypothetical protein
VPPTVGDEDGIPCPMEDQRWKDSWDLPYKMMIQPGKIGSLAWKMGFMDDQWVDFAEIQGFSSPKS